MLPNLPFQPEEEETLESLIDHGMKFREYVAQFINPLISSPDELTTQRFCLRKLEGAEILLSDEINFFRQELHKWAPVAPAPPPILQVSLSTRKPRPTKRQKLMNSMGITNPDPLSQHLRTHILETSGPRLTSPMQDLFKSSGSGQEMFGEAMDMVDNQIEEGLAATEGNSYIMD